MEKKKVFGLSGNQLKLIAMLAMLCDHAGKLLLPQYRILRVIGRLALPIFAYMIAEGCLYTKNRARYFALIFGLGLGCQAVYFIVERSLYFNILITFSLSVLLIFAADRFLKKKDLLSGLLALFPLLAVVFVGGVLPEILKNGFKVDYGLCGIFLPVAVYFMPNKPLKLLSAGIVLAVLAYTNTTIQWFALGALPLLALYSGERGKYKLKYLFYIFYPTHLLVLYFLDMFI